MKIYQLMRQVTVIQGLRDDRVGENYIEKMKRRNELSTLAVIAARVFYNHQAVILMVEHSHPLRIINLYSSLE